DPRCRDRMKEWILAAMDIALAMGTDAIGGHWDALSCEVLEDQARTRAVIRLQQETFRELARIARQKGLRSLYNEQMYIPSEVPWTLQQAREFLVNVNRDNGGVPVYLTVDVGHQAGMHYGLTGDDLSYEAWLREFGAFAEIVHLQQTTPDASHHWPFTREYNRRGHVSMEAVMDALRESHERCEESPIIEHLAPAKVTYLVAEIIPGSTKTETALLEELRESAEYLSQYVPEEGLTWTFD
ncbi:MAG: sugar phosphate isomerase/epimerase family protein, partial [Armatimonadota bacterium]